MPLDVEYSKLSHEQHVLQLPDTYVGDTDVNSQELWCYDEKENKMVKKTIQYIPAEYKLFDEIIVNSVDQYIRIKEANNSDLFPVKNIKITTDRETGEITVYNDGEGIKVDIDPKEQKYIPELIFGDLLTSSNYSKEDIKHVGGKNGYGAKLVNIFSKKFTIETIDSYNKKKFSLTFYDNKSRKDKPSIRSNTGKPYTKISYIPDYSRFNSSGLTSDMENLILTRAYDLAAFTDSNVSIYYNGSKIDCKSFSKFIDLFLGDKKEYPRVYEIINDRWEIGVALTPNTNFEQISFVNGINTYKGGKHVDYIVNQITKKLAAYITKKKKMTVKQNFIKDNIIVFIKCTIDNPSFSSQTKEFLTTNKDKFGSKCDISDKFIESLSKCGIIEKAIELSSLKDSKTLKKTDGKMTNRIKGIPKLEDANWAGGKKSSQCTLILTEGDSAKSLAMAGLSVIGRDKYGVFPLKGKLINVRDVKNITKLMENNELNHIKKIMGLETGKVYKNTENLRYGKIMVLADQDEDGSHIKGLVFNLFESLWPSLFKQKGFITSMLTPIVKVKCSKCEDLEFYSLKDFEKWEKESSIKINGKWSAKYYKGLGTSTPKEAKNYFKELKIVEYTVDNDIDIDSLKLAFNKNDNSADKRKQWLSKYDKEATLDYTNFNVSITDFINEDLKHFSNSDNIRSIPSILDGLKPSQRKVLFGCIKRNLVKTEIKVAQLAGYISENAAYHHGEASLQGTIVNMAQNFVGSNNIEILEPIGQFGTRIQGGKDSAQPRYIFTKLNKISTSIFNKLDLPILKPQVEEGMSIEPQFYMPILPMIIVNGCQGIGTGWSTDIPCFNPFDIINNINRFLENKPLHEMIPYYRGFNGKILKTETKQIVSKGIYKLTENKLEITELPIGMWTDKYKEFLESITIDSKNKSNKQLIRYYNSYCTDEKVHFEIYLDTSKQANFNTKEKLEKTFKLISPISMSNMVLYNADGLIQKYNSVIDIIKEYANERLVYYNMRKDYIMNELDKEIYLLEIKIKFINEFINDTLKIFKVKKQAIIDQLKEKKYPLIEESYDYLIKMPIYNLTEDKIEEFENNLQNKKNELEVIKSTSPTEMWKNDIEVVKTQLNEMGYTENKKKLKIIN